MILRLKVNKEMSMYAYINCMFFAQKSADGLGSL